MRAQSYQIENVEIGESLALKTFVETLFLSNSVDA